MTIERFGSLGPAWAAVGEEAMHVIGGEPDGILLYVEIGDRWVEPSLFKDEGSSIRYVDLDDSAIFDLITAAWCLEPADKRWTAMKYTIDHGKFAAEFGFDDLENVKDEDTGDRRERVLRARYGDKPVIYSPLSPYAWTLKPPA